MRRGRSTSARYACGGGVGPRSLSVALLLLAFASTPWRCALGQLSVAFLPESVTTASRSVSPSEDAMAEPPWIAMDYGAAISATLQIGPEHYARKGIAVRADHGDGGFSRGTDYIVFDTDTLRCAAGWRGGGGVDWRGLAFDGVASGQPSIVGSVLFENPDAPGWGSADTAAFVDSRPVARDGERYGPVHDRQGRWLGHYKHGSRIIWSYEAIGAEVLESPEARDAEGLPILMRHFEIGARPRGMLLQVAYDPTGAVQVHGASALANEQAVTFAAPGVRGNLRREREGTESDGLEDDEEAFEDEEELEDDEAEDDFLDNLDDNQGLVFEGDVSLRVARAEDFDLTTSDYTIVARIRTREGGTIFSEAPATGAHAPNTKSLYVADGVLQFDIGWVGVVRSRREVADGEEHVVAVTFRHEDSEVKLYVDGQLQGQSKLRPTGPVEGERVVRLGFTTPDFPDDVRGFEGLISEAAFYERALSDDQLRSFADGAPPSESIVAHWNRFDHAGDQFLDAAGSGNNAMWEDAELEVAGEEPFDEERDAARTPVRFDGEQVRIAFGDIRGDRLVRRSYTIAARIRTERGGPIFAIAGSEGSWEPNSVCWFVRDGRLVFDMGFVGQVEGWANVADGEWHNVALTYDGETGRVGFVVDGEDDRVRALNADTPGLLRPIEPEEEPGETSAWIGYASEQFPEDAPRYFSGEVESLRIYSGVQSGEEIAHLMSMHPAESLGVLGAWVTAYSVDGVIEDFSDNERDGIVEGGPGGAAAPPLALPYTACRVLGAPPGSKWRVTDDGQVRLALPPGDAPARFTVFYTPVEQRDGAAALDARLSGERTSTPDLASMCAGGRSSWNQTLVAKPKTVGDTQAAFVVEDLTPSASNPYGSRLRLTALDFFGDGHTAAVATLAGDVWLVDGLGAESLDEVTWSRFATGLHQPLGLKIVHGDIYVLCRGQITRLRDLNDDGEADFYECFNNDAQVTPHGRDFAVGLESDENGSFYYARGTTAVGEAPTRHHGSLLKVDSDGASTEFVADGFHSPSGLYIDADGSIVLTDLEGYWTPKHRINVVKEGGFYGNRNAQFEPNPARRRQSPLMWVHGEFDKAPSRVLRVTSDRWGPLNGGLICLSNSGNAIHCLLGQLRGDSQQAGLYRMPMPSLPVAAGHGRFNPRDGQLYACGMVDAASGALATRGRLYRVRHAGRPVTLPLGLVATEEGVTIAFSQPLDPESATDWRNYAAARWSYRRTKQFGSDDYRVSDPRRRGRDRLLVDDVVLSDDRRRVTLLLADMCPSDQMELRCRVQSRAGDMVSFTFHQTVHRLKRERPNAPRFQDQALKRR